MRSIWLMFVIYTIIILSIFFMRTLTVSEVKERVVNKTLAMDNTPKSLYFVNTIKCTVPYVDPFDADTLSLYKPMEFEACTNESNLVTPIYDASLRRYKLRVNRNVAKQLLNSTNDAKYQCFYQEIARNIENDGYLRYWTFFEQDQVVPLHVEALIVTCREIYNNRSNLQTDAYTLMQYKPPEAEEIGSMPKRKPSVIMLGIDSMSRMNLRRTMPNVFKFLIQDGWYELQGYNKIGDNTFPNLMAILTGYSMETIKANICDPSEKGCLDRLPFIWKYFKNASYVTALAEDDADIITFNYLRPGFREQPTDYYLRPYQKAFEARLRTWKCSKCTRNYCIGRRIASSYVYDMCLEFVRRYLGRPFWGLFWSNTFSHDHFALPSKMDKFMLEYLNELQKVGVFEESIVFFLSDHGARFGDLMKLRSAFLEERLPAMFIYLPPWFRQQYPKYSDSLALNQNRLTSNYDVHNTLKHIIELGQVEGETIPRAFDCPKCQSLFLPVSKQRSCVDAGIPEHFCSCKRFERIAGKWTKIIALGVIDRINEYLKEKNMSQICSHLTLKQIHDIEININSPDLGRANYRVRFMVKERNATFHATLTFNNITKNAQLDVEQSISRTNSYKEDANCINDEIAKLYCICYDKL